MPRRSDRQLLIRNLHRAIKYSWIMELVEPASESTARYQRGLQDDLLSTLALVYSRRFLKKRNPIPKQYEYRELIQRLGEEDVRDEIRMDIESFERLV
ncbi:hypothetical protein HDV05_006482, partial [Chytridiales sp. JEL 0842]